MGKGGSWAQESGWKRRLSAVSVSSTADCTGCSVCLSGIGWPRSARAAKRGNRCSRRPADTVPRLSLLITAGRVMETSPPVTPHPRMPIWQAGSLPDCLAETTLMTAWFYIYHLFLYLFFYLFHYIHATHHVPALGHNEPGSGVGYGFWVAGQVFCKHCVLKHAACKAREHAPVLFSRLGWSRTDCSCTLAFEMGWGEIIKVCSHFTKWLQSLKIHQCDLIIFRFVL